GAVIGGAIASSAYAYGPGYGYYGGPYYPSYGYYPGYVAMAPITVPALGKRYKNPGWCGSTDLTDMAGAISKADATGCLFQLRSPHGLLARPRPPAMSAFAPLLRA